MVLGALSFNSSVSFSLASTGANLTSILDDESSQALKKSLQATLAQGTGISKDEVWPLRNAGVQFRLLVQSNYIVTSNAPWRWTPHLSYSQPFFRCIMSTP